MFQTAVQTISGPKTGQSPADSSSFLARHDRIALFTCGGCALIGFLFPFPVIKLVTGLILAVTSIRFCFKHFYLAVSLFIFSLPLHDMITKSSFAVRGINIQTLSILFFLLLALTLRGQHEAGVARWERPQLRNPMLAPLVALLGVLIFSAVHGALVSDHNFLDLLARIKNWFAYSIFAVLAFNYIQHRREKLVVVSFIFLAVLLNVAFSLNQVANNLAAGIIFLRHRATSLILPQPNLYAGFLAMYLFFFLAFLLYYPLSRRARIAFGCCTALVAINLVYTLSRGAWLAAACALLFVMATKSKKLVLPLIPGLFALYLWAPEHATDRLESTFEEEQYNLSHLTAEETDYDEAASRIIQWRTFGTMLAESPLVGIGFDRYAERFYQRGFDFKPRAAHSTIIEIAVEEGILGLILYLWLLVAIYRHAAIIFKQSNVPLDRVLSLGLLGATVCLFLLDFTGTRFRNGNLMAYFWILSGITLNAGLREEKQA